MKSFDKGKLSGVLPMAKRLSYIELANKACSVKTFKNEVYKLKGSLAVNQDNGNIEKIADIYYRVRTALNDDDVVVAKRKQSEEELKTVNKKHNK